MTETPVFRKVSMEVYKCDQKDIKFTLIVGYQSEQSYEFHKKWGFDPVFDDLCRVYEIKTNKKPSEDPSDFADEYSWRMGEDPAPENSKIDIYVAESHTESNIICHKRSRAAGRFYVKRLTPKQIAARLRNDAKSKEDNLEYFRGVIEYQKQKDALAERQ